ncbi:MAG: hypothetical protein AMXMBFR36_30750 [Acidobacteriota bacterium]
MSGETSFQISCIVTEADHLAATYTNMRPRPVFKYLGWGVAALGVLALAAVLPDVIEAGGFRSFGFWLFAALFAYFPLYFGILVPRHVRRLYRQTKAAGRPTTYSIDDSGLTLQSENGSGSVPWPDFHRWKEGRSCLLLYINQALFIILPKRAFSADQLAATRAYLHQHVRRIG